VRVEQTWDAPREAALALHWPFAEKQEQWSIFQLRERILCSFPARGHGKHAYPLSWASMRRDHPAASSQLKWAEQSFAKADPVKKTFLRTSVMPRFRDVVISLNVEHFLPSSGFFRRQWLSCSWLGATAHVWGQNLLTFLSGHLPLGLYRNLTLYNVRPEQQEEIPPVFVWSTPYLFGVYFKQKPSPCSKCVYLESFLPFSDTLLHGRTLNKRFLEGASKKHIQCRRLPKDLLKKTQHRRSPKTYLHCNNI
jgi:hypothetical protein